jgi:hypothetical protein
MCWKDWVEKEIWQQKTSGEKRRKVKNEITRVEIFL